MKKPKKKKKTSPYVYFTYEQSSILSDVILRLRVQNVSTPNPFISNNKKNNNDVSTRRRGKIRTPKKKKKKKKDNSNNKKNVATTGKKLEFQQCKNNERTWPSFHFTNLRNPRRVSTFVSRTRSPHFHTYTSHNKQKR